MRGTGRGLAEERAPRLSEAELARARLDRVIAAETQAAKLLRENEWLWSEVHRLDRKYDRLVEIIKRGHAIRSTGGAEQPTCMDAPPVLDAATCTDSAKSSGTTTSSVAMSADSSERLESFLSSAS